MNRKINQFNRSWAETETIKFLVVEVVDSFGTSRSSRKVREHFCAEGRFDGWNKRAQSERASSGPAPVTCQPSRNRSFPVSSLPEFKIILNTVLTSLLEKFHLHIR